MSAYLTKDSGERAEYGSGMVRDSEKGKPRFDLLLPLGVPFADQMLTRDALLMARGAEKYDARNWEKARGTPELARYHSSALRHLLQWIAGEDDEDHAAAVRFNIMAGEFVKRHINDPVLYPWSVEPDSIGFANSVPPLCGECGFTVDHGIGCPRYEDGA